jgi:hypothetical protein
MRTLPVTLVALALLAACGEGTTGPAGSADPIGAGTGSTTSTAAPPLGEGPYPVADLTVRVFHPERELVYTVTCLGDTATVTGEAPGVDERAACLALAEPEVVEWLVEGPPEGQVCTEVYGGPDTAEITGMIDDAAVVTRVTRDNGCGIDAWDRLLGDILPPALGPT